MTLQTLNGAARRKRQLLAVDLGSRTTKAVFLQRRGDSLVLCNYVLADAPIFEKTLSPDLLGEHLKGLLQDLGAPRVKSVALAISANDAFVRHVEMPRVPAEGLNLVLRHNAKGYLQQDLTGQVIDCHVIYEGMPQTAGAAGAKPQAGTLKQKMLVTGAKRQLIEDLAAGVRHAGLVAEYIVPSLISPVNAFERALPEVFEKEIVALVDVGFKGSSICILQRGELMLLRAVAIGGDRLTTAVAEALNVSYAEAEGIKLGMPGEVQGVLESVVSSLARELRASIDFYEHQQDKAVTQVFVSGGSTRSELVIQILQNELMAQCRTWNPVASLQVALSPEQAAELEQIAPLLAVATGAALIAS
jgi:type IV pilus assembly protein PilM